MAFYFVHPLRDNGRDLSTYDHHTYVGHDDTGYYTKVDISSFGEYNTGGNKVVAMADGVVDIWYGSDLVITIHCTDPGALPVKSYRYVHLNYDTLEVSSGDTVKAGQTIGYVANPGEPGYGTAQGAHLHVDFSQTDERCIFEKVSGSNYDNFVSQSYFNVDMYNSLCNTVGEPADSPYIFPYLIWSQTPHSVSSVTTRRNSLVLPDGTSISDEVQKAAIAVFCREGTMDWFNSAQTNPEDYLSQMAAAQAVLRCFCTRVNRTKVILTEEDWFDEANYWNGSPPFFETVMDGVEFFNNNIAGNTPYIDFCMAELEGRPQEDWIEKLVQDGERWHQREGSDLNDLATITQFAGQDLIPDYDGGSWHAGNIDIGWLYRTTENGYPSGFLILGRVPSKAENP